CSANSNAGRPVREGSAARWVTGQGLKLCNVLTRTELGEATRIAAARVHHRPLTYGERCPAVWSLVGRRPEPRQQWNRIRGCTTADAVIRIYDAAGNVIETHQHKGDFKEL